MVHAEKTTSALRLCHLAEKRASVSRRAFSAAITAIQAAKQRVRHPLIIRWRTTFSLLRVARSPSTCSAHARSTIDAPAYFQRRANRSSCAPRSSEGERAAAQHEACEGKRAAKGIASNK